MSWYKSGLHHLQHTVSRAARFVHHPPKWFAAAFPLMTMENQKYWVHKLAGARGDRVYDAATRQVLQKALGPQGPALLDVYNKVAEDAANGHVDAQEIIAHAPEIAHIAHASSLGPSALAKTLAETKSVVRTSGENLVVGASEKQSPTLPTMVVAGILSGVALMFIAKKMSKSAAVPAGPTREMLAHQYAVKRYREKGIPWS